MAPISRPLSLVTLVVVVATGPARAAAQDDDGPRDRVATTQIVSTAVGASLALVGPIFDINTGPPSCAPCDPDDLPGIDRWVVRTEQPGWNVASTVLELGLLGATWYEMSGQADGRGRVAASLEAVAWTIGLNELSNAIIDRERPVLYTEEAAEAMTEVDSHRSMPSGHTSISFAAATSYVLSMSHKRGLSRFWPLAAAAGVGVMRMAAARHFTTDVLAGAALGSGTAIVIHAIRF
jgi:membrane-associated phospholipid phosphatase